MTRFFMIRICDNTKADTDSCQYEDIGDEGAYLEINAASGYFFDDLMYCEECSEDIINDIITDECDFPRLESSESDYAISVEIRNDYPSTGYQPTIYYSLEVAKKIYAELKERGLTD